MATMRITFSLTIASMMAWNRLTFSVRGSSSPSSSCALGMNSYRLAPPAAGAPASAAGMFSGSSCSVSGT